MTSNRQLFLQYLAQTSDFPLMLEVERAEGIYIHDPHGKAYVDLIAGVSVSNLGHKHPAVVRAVKEQADKHMHLMVYGEYVQAPQVRFAHALADLLPGSLNSVYFVNSGSEATEGAMKLAKRYTGRNEIISFQKAYHGSTQGALSIIGSEAYRNAFRPLIPGIRQLNFNEQSQFDQISENTACVVAEPIQAEAGVVLPGEGYLQRLRQRCNETGALLVFDEAQTGFGRTGSLFAFQQYGVIPDILLLAKSLGGGLPLGAFIASGEIMASLKNSPALGHITTFGGHPLSCAAGLAAFQVLLECRLTDEVPEKEQLVRSCFAGPGIREVRGKGLLLAVQLDSHEQVRKVISKALEEGLILDWFLFCDSALRLAPPLIITMEQLGEACSRLKGIIIEVSGRS
jgi:acetylornithine/succinyldiaminopimelate/putrescine aminotransferase